MQFFKIGDVVEYTRYNLRKGWENVVRVVLKVTKHSVILSDDVLSNDNIFRLTKID